MGEKMLPFHPLVREAMGYPLAGGEGVGDDVVYSDILDMIEGQMTGTSLITQPGADDIIRAGLQIIGMLLAKNAAYGNSALDPVSVFASDLTPAQRLGVRMDDKLSRMQRGSDAGEDPALDLTGYLVLKLAAEVRARELA